MRMPFDYLEFRILKEEDHFIVWNLMLEEYFTREPVCAFSNFSPTDAKMFVGDFVNDTLWQGASLGAFDKESKELVAIQLNILGKKKRKYYDDDDSRYPLHVKQAIGLMDHVSGGSPYDVMKTEHFMQFIVLCCKESYSHRGIATELYLRSEEIARKEGCRKIFTLATNNYTFKIIEKLGFQVIKEMQYIDYVDSFTNEKIFNNIAQPHTKLALVEKQLC